jgi:hypothetical protein
MPYLTGMLMGIVLTVLVLFLVDNLGLTSGARPIVNWNALGQTLGAVKEEVRKDVHEATAPPPDTSSPAQRP